MKKLTDHEITTLSARILGWIFLAACIYCVIKFAGLISDNEDAAFLALFFAIGFFFAGMFSFVLAKING